MRIALTFDDGPSEWTGPILDLLAEHQAKATFFVCGANILGHVPLIDRIHEEGHELGNHTTNHPDLSTLDPAEVRAELAETAAMLHLITGQVPAVWRAPYLRQPEEQQPFAHIGCNVIPEDWRQPDPNRVAGKVLADAADGSVVLLHDGRPPGQLPFDDGGSLDGRQHVVEALERILPALRVRGFEMVTVSDLLLVST